MLTVLVTALSVASAGCKQPLRPQAQPTKFTHHFEAGTGHVAVLSVAPWDDVVGDLQAKFTLKPADALNEVNRDTAVTERRLLDMLKVVARVGTPQTSRTLTRTASSSAGSSREVTETEEPGVLPEFEPTLPGGKSAEALPDLESVLGSKPTIATGAHTQYLLANALYQEVQLLNRYVENAAVRDGYGAHVVRLQVSLMPHVRTAPYDAYTTLGFFPADAIARGLTPMSGPSPRQLPVVVPLLVTDDMEAALASDSTEAVRQYALALSAMIQGFAIGGDAERYTDELVTTVTRDFNSVYQVARLGENSLRVRMGARLHSSGHHFMVPQTHNVTVLVLTPGDWRPASELRVEARTEFRHAETGEVLLPRDRGSVTEPTLEQFRLFGMDPSDLTRKDLERIREAGSANDYGAFRACVQRFWPPPSKDPACPRCPSVPGDQNAYSEQTVRRLWVALSGIATGGQYTSTLYTLPAARCPVLPCGPCKESRAVAIEDKTSLTVELRGVANVKDTDLAVRLLIRSKCGTKEAKVAVPASAVRVERLGRRLLCVFPPLARLETAQRKPVIDLLTDQENTACLRVEYVGPTQPGCASPCATEYGVTITRLNPLAAAEPMVRIVAPPALKGCGCGPALPYTFTVKRTKETPGGAVKVRVRFAFTSLDGSQAVAGRVVEADPTETTLDIPLGFEADAPTVVTVHLEQLVDASLLRIEPRLVLHGANFAQKADASASPAGQTRIFVDATPTVLVPSR